MEDLWLKVVGDLDYNYNRRACYLEKQTEIQSIDVAEGEFISFRNIYNT